MTKSKHNLYVESGRKGGKAKVPKGFSTMDKSILREIGAKGGRNRSNRIRRERKANI